MRLINKSHFKDYYDACIGYGIDPLVVYVREHKEYTIDGWKSSGKEALEAAGFYAARKKMRLPISMQYAFSTRIGGDDSISMGFVGFCGQIYPFICVMETTPGGWRWNEKYHDMMQHPRTEKMVLIHSLDELKHYVSNNPKNPGVAKLLGHKEIASVFDVIDAPEAFMLAKAPIIAFAQNTYHVNPRLLDFRFAERVDGIQAFQQISAYISGTLQAMNQMPPIAITDAQRAETKGFDKNSFRTRGSAKA